MQFPGVTGAAEDGSSHAEMRFSRVDEHCIIQILQVPHLLLGGNTNRTLRLLMDGSRVNTSLTTPSSSQPTPSDCIRAKWCTWNSVGAANALHLARGMRNSRASGSRGRWVHLARVVGKAQFRYSSVRDEVHRVPSLVLLLVLKRTVCSEAFARGIIFLL